jgi:hypothetical protein
MRQVVACGPPKAQKIKGVGTMRLRKHANRILLGAMICSGGLMACFSMALSLKRVPHII